ncbi:formate dehydrogenase family accessory protein FdhD [Sphingomonas sp. Leaf231]|uniref:formate dehydrogenase accessory sulfurtransferase FdhD n=1 Tax=Sphingomonas sp. Leaf231 TaxID=1736301 RepID=UPI0006FE243F|nr:formate dehydrogenase accessory sulfurtransferase FdhD [Sphingomonas sp. Leaf231]KQN92559.1 formate dehydrogenase family accessory protein FdhD [Sphingomonas sp. Leaf231]
MTTTHLFRRLARDSNDSERVRAVVEEAPVAIEVNGIGYAVMMATPSDVEDFATGFALAERIVDDVADIDALDVHDTGRGTIVRIAVSPTRAAAVMERVRRRTSDSSCGLCGMDNLDAVHRPLPCVPRSAVGGPALFTALAAMRDHQPLHRATGAAHAAMLCDAAGAIRLAREDVGRHNAFDKLIGAMARGGAAWDGGFALLSSRCSYELVEKAALAGCPMLVTVSAATSLALSRAAAAGLTLVSLARDDAVLFSDPGVGDG